MECSCWVLLLGTLAVGFNRLAVLVQDLVALVQTYAVDLPFTEQLQPVSHHLAVDLKGGAM